MTKRHWRDTIKALGSHIDPEQDEQVKKTKIGIHFFSKQPQLLQYYWRLWDCPIDNKYTRYKAQPQAPLQCYPPQRLFWCALPEHFNPVLIIPERDLDDRVAKLMKLIQHKSKSKSKRGGGPIFDSELIELIDDFHKKYQALYSLYEHLKGHLQDNICILEDKDNSSLSSSSSASFCSSSELEPDNSIQQFEEIKTKCIRLGECLVEREREIQYLSTEMRELGEQNDGLRELIQEHEMTLKQREEKLSDLLIKLEENEVDLISKSKDLMEKANDLQHEVDALWSEKEIVYQEGEIVQVISPHKSKSESSLLKVEESLSFLLRLELLKSKFERKNKEFLKIVEEKKGLETQMKYITIKYAQLEMENEDLNVRVSELEESLMERDHDVFILEEEFEGLKNNSSVRIKDLEKEIANLQKELKNKEKHYQEVIRGKEEVIINIIEEKTQINTKYSESNLKKVEETSGEIQKEIDESVGSAEVAIDKVKDISATTNEIMSGLNYVEMKFQECNGRFLNKISTCTDKAAKVKSKNNVMNEMEGNLDILCGEVGRKEDEIMELKERIWKLENDMTGLGQEKREAIRQLCVWIDYHRTQNNNLKKILSNLRIFRGRRFT